MSNVVGLLKKQAAELRSLLATSNEDAEWTQVKSAAVSALVQGGMKKEDAEGTLPALENEAGVPHKTVETGIDLAHVAEVLEKTAAYIEEVESNLSDSYIKIKDMEAELEKSASERDSGIISALKEKGFSDTDIANLRSLPKDTIEKVAQLNEKAWDFGEATGPARGGQEIDAITAFCFS